MVSVSMDGPNVNWCFFEMLQQKHAEHFGGAQLAVVGSCGLHTLHNSSNVFVYYKSNVCYAVVYVLNITDNLNKMFYLIQVAYLYIIIF